ncbi:hypothetical protein QBC43DRAFT_284963 [Cladorrhinum sp. PSN259]|nr:hypothetical protein QBC43DRAFT_284963 [Cladorrhinum sp. PSN259]
MNLPTLTKLLLTSLFLALAHSAPDSVSPNDKYTNPLVKRGELCHDTNYQDQGSLGSPSVEDCQGLADRIDYNHKYGVSFKQRGLAKYNQCIIGFTAWGGTYSVGGGDLRRWINESIKKYGRDMGDGIKRVGSEGDVECGGVNMGTWGIYHTK